MADELIIDGTHLSWQEFVDRLVALNDSPQHASTIGYIRAPTACGLEARRLLRDLDLDDRIALVADARPRHSSGMLLLGPIVDLVSSVVAALKPPVTQHRPFHD